MPDRTYALPLVFQATSPVIVQKLIRWFESEGRTFTWRAVERALDRNRTGYIHDPYVILVSEVMLQQTQTTRVAERLPQFLEQFPTVEALASASRGDVIRAWQGMGYNRRALGLQSAAREVVENHGGVFPRSLEALAALPGIGRYTASAVLCFAFGEDVPVVDVNVIRVLSRLFFKCHTPAQRLSEGAIYVLADAIMPRGDSNRWHQALMDLGATICTAKRPACSVCPLEHQCLSAHPMPIELFGGASRPEPEIRGVPRRVWRGRMIELLREHRDGMRLAEMIDRLVPRELFGGASRAESTSFLAIAADLIAEGFIERAGVVREGEVMENDLVRLVS